MKRILFPIALVIMLVSCQPQQNHEAEVERLSLEKQALEDQMQAKESALNDFLVSLNQIEENLQTIKEKEGRISRGTGAGLEGRPDLMDNINEDIRVVGELMEQNRQLMARLNRDFNASNLRIAELDKMLARLNNQLQEKEIEISVLRDELSNMNVRVEYLTATVDTLEDLRRRQTQVIEQKNLELNTAWFAMGSQAELRQQGIISREGGFLGLGRTVKLNPEFDQDYFTRLDITHTPQITIPGRKPRIISTHPEGSYKIRSEGDIFFLDIEDYRRFWSTSRHLVIEIE